MANVNDLIKGFNRFHNRYYVKNPELFKQLAEVGQNPQIMMITCSDSRIEIGTITDVLPGDVFLLRSVANLVPCYKNASHHEGTTAAIEFAVRDLKVSDLIVMGHSQCGGIKALMGGDNLVCKDSHVFQWVQVFNEARDETLEKHGNANFEEQCSHCEKISIAHSIENLKTYPWIQEKITEGSLNLHGWYFELEQGALLEITDGGDGTKQLAP